MNRTGLVIFDFDGVLVNTQELISRLEWSFLVDYGLELSLEMYSIEFSGRSSLSTIETLQKEGKISFKNDPIFLGKKTDNFVLENLCKGKIPPLKGMREFLINLPFKKCIASNCPLKTLQRLLVSSELETYFKTNVFSAGRVHSPKPAPDLFLHACQAMGFTPEDCLVVEDSSAGIEAAQAAHMEVVGFVGGTHALYEGYRRKISQYGIPLSQNVQDLEKQIQRWENEGGNATKAPLISMYGA